MTSTSTFTDADWDEYARCYDVICALIPYQELMRDITAQLPKQATNILDAGCGTGNLLRTISDARDTPLVGIDRSTQMLTRARRKLVGTATTLVSGDLTEQLPFVDASFDCIVCSNVLYTLPDPATFLGELHRVLQPGGKAIIATPKAGFDNGLIMKAHAKSPKSDDWWRDPHRSPKRERKLIKAALGSGPLAVAMETVAYFNRRIAQHQQFGFFLEDELRQLCTDTGFGVQMLKPTYAKQGYVVTMSKE